MVLLQFLPCPKKKARIHQGFDQAILPTPWENRALLYEGLTMLVRWTSFMASCDMTRFNRFRVRGCRPGVLSGLRKRSLSPFLPLRMRHRGAGAEFQSEPGVWGGMCHLNLHGPTPPKPGGLGWSWTLGKTAHFAGTKLFPR